MTIDEKACALKLVLIDFDKHLPHNFIVLIEYQMNANHMSNAIFNMIVYHYAGRAAIHTVFPSLKNSIYMNNKLKLSDFLASASSNYSANKNHCKYNFLYFMFLFRHEHLIKDINKKYRWYRRYVHAMRRVSFEKLNICTSYDTNITRLIIYCRQTLLIKCVTFVLQWRIELN